jgi:hypothetical protein
MSSGYTHPQVQHNPHLPGGPAVIVLGLLCLLLGYLLGVGIVVTIGWILVIIGIVLLVLGHAGALTLGGRRYWY